MDDGYADSFYNRDDPEEYTLEDFKDELRRFIKHGEPWCDKYGYVKIKKLKEDELTEEQLKELSKSASPKDALIDFLDEKAQDFMSEGYEKIEYSDFVFRHLSFDAQDFYEKAEDDCVIVMENYLTYYYDENDFPEFDAYIAEHQNM